MPPTPPSSHGSDSDGSQSPRSLPPSSPARPAARSSTAISSSPLLTAPHVRKQQDITGTQGFLVLRGDWRLSEAHVGDPGLVKVSKLKCSGKAMGCPWVWVWGQHGAHRRAERYNESCTMPIRSYLVLASAVFHPILWEMAYALEDFLRRLMEERSN